jgi:hypothetical protein
LAGIVVPVFCFPSQVAVAILNLVICVVSHEEIPTQLLVFGCNIGKSDSNASVEIASLVVTGIQEKNRISVFGELGGNWSAARTRPDDDVIVGFDRVKGLGSREGRTGQGARGDHQGPEANEIRSHVDLGIFTGIGDVGGRGKGSLSL